MKRVLLTLLFLVLPVLLVVWQVCSFCIWSGSRSLLERWRCCPS